MCMLCACYVHIFFLFSEIKMLILGCYFSKFESDFNLNSHICIHSICLLMRNVTTTSHKFQRGGEFDCFSLGKNGRISGNRTVILQTYLLHIVLLLIRNEIKINNLGVFFPREASMQLLKEKQKIGFRLTLISASSGGSRYWEKQHESFCYLK